jgi:hypothetical protein
MRATCRNFLIPKGRGNTTSFAFYKQAKRNDPGYSPRWNEGGAPDGDRAPQRLKSSPNAENQDKRRGCPAGQAQMKKLEVVAPHHKGGNAEVCGRRVSIVESWKVNPKSSLSKGKQQREELAFPKSHRECQSQDLNSGLLTPGHNFFSCSKGHRLMGLQVKSRSARSCPDVGSHKKPMWTPKEVKFPAVISVQTGRVSVANVAPGCLMGQCSYREWWMTLKP